MKGYKKHETSFEFDQKELECTFQIENHFSFIISASTRPRIESFFSSLQVRGLKHAACGPHVARRKCLCSTVVRVNIKILLIILEIKALYNYQRCPQILFFSLCGLRAVFLKIWSLDRFEFETPVQVLRRHFLFLLPSSKASFRLFCNLFKMYKIALHCDSIHVLRRQF